MFRVKLFQVLRRRLFSTDMTTLIERFQVLPDVVQEEPHRIMEVLYTTTNVKALMGNIVKPEKIKDEPCLNWVADVSRYYTVAMVDPDAPHRSAPKMSQFLHWLVTNIPGTSIERGTTLAEYIGAGPPQGSGLHRYVFLVYRQDDAGELENFCIKRHTAKGRPNFNISKFAQKHNLYGPVGVNYFLAEWDPYVSLLYKQLGMPGEDLKKIKKQY